MSDIEGSTRLWATHGAAMAEALRTHDGLFAAAIVEGGGELFKHTGDGVIARFEAASSAIAAAVAASRALAGTVWGDTGPIRSRIGIHAGEAEARGGDYYGAALNRTARLMAVGRDRQKHDDRLPCRRHRVGQTRRRQPRTAGHD